MSEPQLILGSQSPRRRELLAHLIPEQAFLVEPPNDFEESPFVGDDLKAIHRQIGQLAEAKGKAVSIQRALREAVPRPILTADTTVALEESDGVTIFEKPPTDQSYEPTVRDWLRRLSGREHVVISAVSLLLPGTVPQTVLVQTFVEFIEYDDEIIDWYLSTGEPRGKAGGTALQGAGSLLVAGLKGSPSNVIGLPLKETRDLLQAISDQAST